MELCYTAVQATAGTVTQHFFPGIENSYDDSKKISDWHQMIQISPYRIGIGRITMAL